MTPHGESVGAAALGGAAAVLTDVACRTVAPGRRTAVLAVALPVAAAIYPLARTGWSERGPVARELLGLLAFSVVGGLGASRAGATGNRIAAAGWLAHAAFDAVHDRGRRSRIPAWYPAMCAGYDVTVAGLLARS